MLLVCKLFVINTFVRLLIGYQLIRSAALHERGGQPIFCELQALVDLEVNYSLPAVFTYIAGTVFWNTLLDLGISIALRK